MVKATLPRYFSDWDELDTLRERLKQIPCPHCGRIGMLNLHGALRGYAEDDSSRQTFRGQRVFCSNRCRRKGCGRTASILKSSVIHGFTVGTALLWRLILQVFLPNHSEFPELILSPRHRRALVARLTGRMSSLRTTLTRHSRPPPVDTVNPFIQTIQHLRTAFTAHADPIAAFQHNFQVSFL